MRNQALRIMNNKQEGSSPITYQNVYTPPSTIGILGGGQLGRMMAMEAKEMGYRIVTLDPTPDSPCAQVADKQVVAAFDSIEGARQLAQQSEVITYEFENISADMAQVLEQESYLPQGYKLLYLTQNRLREKEAIEQAGGRVAPYLPIYNYNDVVEGIEQFGYPAVLKTTQGGYDGKGQLVLRQAKDLEEVQALWQDAAIAATSSSSPNATSPTAQEWVLEKFIPFEKEISVIVARSPRGETKAFPVAENIHQHNILHLSIAPARITVAAEQQASSMAIELAQKLNLVGLLAIEMFLQEDGRIIINELAPRPHNSGHYTQQACLTSQFEQHIRAVCNLPLGETTIIQPTVMVNILGEHLETVLNRLPELDASFKLHLYGKKEAKHQRKMGHLNVTAENTSKALQKINKLGIWDMEGIE